jgi:hypothetical protein
LNNVDFVNQSPVWSKIWIVLRNWPNLREGTLSDWWVNSMKNEAWNWISENEKMIIEASEKVWNLAELGLS